jgi:hypothetical protein
MTVFLPAWLPIPEYNTCGYRICTLDIRVIETFNMLWCDPEPEIEFYLFKYPVSLLQIPWQNAAVPFH